MSRHRFTGEGRSPSDIHLDNAASWERIARGRYYTTPVFDRSGGLVGYRRHSIMSDAERERYRRLAEEALARAISEEEHAEKVDTFATPSPGPPRKFATWPGGPTTRRAAKRRLR